ncbi:LysR family transcriptional regulator [Simiduia curdlanivorans]|uniref:LysR family transcriptional regulator n=1 Tax=Simiduia curdlanivorans TaxID=1492769 RepID=A0ABV8V5N6_9GAMM|nr:LysR family transcriptional regulator [Simiduia curdlanivorans]MDN3640239.1 LysR family transcriptional regulator [Simiduia curdlanivorans]
MHFSLKQLQVFLAVAHHRNVSRAAEQLSMSQSACSSALKDLESQYGLQLFDRVGKRLQANELGDYLRPKAEALLAQAQEFEQALSQQPDAGELRVGATLTIGNYLAVSLINRYMQDNSTGKVKLEVANTEQITEQLLNFDIDVGMIEGEVQHPALSVQRWRSDELVCFCAPGHPLATHPQVTDADLKEAVWILREQGSGTRQTFDRGMHGLLSNLHISLELQHTEAIKRAVEAGLGISCLSRISLEDAFKRGSLVPLQTPQRDFSRDLYLATHTQKYRGVGLNRWLSICEDYANS